MAVEGHRFMTKTQHYRKVTKPLLERKRRARMNLYLDELKDLIVDTMDAQGEQVNKLEKADILELTVNYLKSQQRVREVNESSNNVSKVAHADTPPLNIDKFRAGYTQAAYEVSQIFSTLPDLNFKFGTHLMKQLGQQLKEIKPHMPHTPTVYEEHSEAFHLTEQQKFPTVADKAAAEDIGKSEDVWRPW